MVTLLVHHRADKGANEAAVSALTQALWDGFGHWGRSVPTPGNARTALAALTWTATVYGAVDERALESEVGKKLVRLQAVLAHVAFGCGQFRLVRSVEKVLKTMWKANTKAKAEAQDRMFKGGMEYDEQVRNV